MTHYMTDALKAQSEQADKEHGEAQLQIQRGVEANRKAKLCEVAWLRMQWLAAVSELSVEDQMAERRVLTDVECWELLSEKYRRLVHASYAPSELGLNEVGQLSYRCSQLEKALKKKERGK